MSVFEVLYLVLTSIEIVVTIVIEVIRNLKK